MVTQVEYVESAPVPDAGASEGDYTAVQVALIERLKERITADGGRPIDFAVEAVIEQDPEDLFGQKRVVFTATRRGAVKAAKADDGG